MTRGDSLNEQSPSFIDLNWSQLFSEPFSRREAISNKQVYFELYNLRLFLFIDRRTGLPGVEGSPWSWVSSSGPKHSVREPNMSKTVITFNEGRCWCGVLPLLEQRKDDTHTHTAWEWGHWWPYPKDWQRIVVDKRKEEQKERFNVTPRNRPMTHHNSLKNPRNTSSKTFGKQINRL